MISILLLILIFVALARHNYYYDILNEMVLSTRCQLKLHYYSIKKLSSSFLKYCFFLLFSFSTKMDCFFEPELMVFWSVKIELKETQTCFLLHPRFVLRNKIKIRNKPCLCTFTLWGCQYKFIGLDQYLWKNIYWLNQKDMSIC